MAIYRLARFEVRDEARGAAEQLMHDYAAYVRKELADTMWTVYRDPMVPTRFTTMTRDASPTATERARKATGTVAFETALAPLLVAPVDVSDCQLVTSSDLAPRHRARR